jgi:hypothetical protein
MEQETRIAELRAQIAELRARLPRHSPPAAMLIELDELEDALRQLLEAGHTGQGQP